MKARWLLALALVVLGCGNLAATDAKTKRLQLVTDSGGFVHDSVGLAEEVLKEIGPKNGFTATATRETPVAPGAQPERAVCSCSS